MIIKAFSYDFGYINHSLSQLLLELKSIYFYRMLTNSSQKTSFLDWISNQTPEIILDDHGSEALAKNYVDVMYLLEDVPEMGELLLKDISAFNEQLTFAWHSISTGHHVRLWLLFLF